MFSFSNKTCIPVFVLIIFALQVMLSSPECCGQGLLRAADVPGGGGGSTSQTEDTGGGGSTLLVVGIVIIAGVLVYKLVIDKDDPKKEDQDSTSQESLLLRNTRKIMPVQYSKQTEMMADIPLNIYIGFQRSDPALSEKKFIMGISCNF